MKEYLTIHKEIIEHYYIVINGSKNRYSTLRTFDSDSKCN